MLATETISQAFGPWINNTIFISRYNINIDISYFIFLIFNSYFYLSFFIVVYALYILRIQINWSAIILQSNLPMQALLISAQLWPHTARAENLRLTLYNIIGATNKEHLTASCISSMWILCIFFSNYPRAEGLWYSFSRKQ